MKDKIICFDFYELEIIKELLSHISCGHERETHYYHCCDANEIIEKINRKLEVNK